MGGLRLPWLKAVHVAEHPFGIEQIDLLHFVGSKREVRKDILENVHTFHPRRSFLALVIVYSTKHCGHKDTFLADRPRLWHG
jgi:hypothetical protein